MSELHEVLAIEAELLTLFLRGTLVYWALYVMFRLAGRRNIGSLGFADVVVVMMVASAVGDSLGGGITTIFDGLIVAGVVIGWSSAVDRVSYFVPAIGKIVEPRSVRLIENGEMNIKHMREQLITRTELHEQLRLNGVSDIADVKLACLEANGEVSVITYGK